MAFVVTAKSGDAAGYPLRFGTVALAWWIKNLGKVTVECRVGRLHCEAGKQRRDHQPTPSILWFRPRLVWVKKCLCDVVAELP